MNDCLSNLLHEADDTAGHRSLKLDLHRRVIQRAQRRKIARRAAVSFVVILMVVPIVWLQHRHSGQQSLIIAIAPRTASPIAQADKYDALVAQKTADAILRLRRSATEVPSPHLDPSIQLRIDDDSTAAMLIAAGDHFSNNEPNAAQARDNYLQVEKYFPKTQWAQIAEDRLKQRHL